MESYTELNKKLDSISTTFAARMSEFERNAARPLDATSSPVAAVSASGMSDEYLAFKDFVLATLSTLKLQLELLSVGQDRLETHSRRKVLLLHGLPEEVTPDPTLLDTGLGGEPVDVPKRVLALLKDKMGLSNIDPLSLESCHRLGTLKAGSDKCRPVLIRFSALAVRNEVWKAKTTLKGSTTSWSEFLTRPRQDVFNAARKHFGVTRCWSSDGAIVVLCPDKNRKKIVSMAELQPLIDKFPLSSVAEAQKKEKLAVKNKTSKEKAAPKTRAERAARKN